MKISGHETQKGVQAYRAMSEIVEFDADTP